MKRYFLIFVSVLFFFALIGIAGDRDDDDKSNDSGIIIEPILNLEYQSNRSVSSEDEAMDVFVEWLNTGADSSKNLYDPIDDPLQIHSCGDGYCIILFGDEFFIDSSGQIFRSEDVVIFRQ